MARDEVIAEIDQAVDQALNAESGMPGFSASQDELSQGQADSGSPENSAAMPGAIFADYDADESTGGGDGGSGKPESGQAEVEGSSASGDPAPEPADKEDSANDQPGGAASPEEGVEGVTQSAVLYAMQSGMSVSDARSFSSDGDLMEAVQIQLSLAAGEGEGPLSGDGGSDTDKDGLSELIKSLDKEDLDPVVLKALGAIAEENTSRRAEVSELRNAQAQAASDVAQRDNHQREQWFDGQIKELGEEFEEVLGKGESSEMLPTSKEYGIRRKIAETVGVMSDGYAARRLPAPPNNALFDQAARVVLGETYQAIHDKSVADGLKGREGQIMNKPSRGRGSNTKSAETETAELLASKFGMNV